MSQIPTNETYFNIPLSTTIHNHIVLTAINDPCLTLHLKILDCYAEIHVYVNLYRLSY